MTSRESKKEICWNAVAENAPVLLGGLGFQLNGLTEGSVYLQSEHVQIRVICGLTTVTTQVVLLSQAYDNDAPTDLWDVIAALSPDVGEDERYPRPVRSAEDVAPEVRRQLQTLVRYCKPLLEGDEAAWAALDAWREDWGGLWQRESESREEYLSRLGEAVSDAWRSACYWRVWGLYQQMSGFRRLSLWERVRWFRASRRTFLVG
jgi:hypothetical protein